MKKPAKLYRNGKYIRDVDDAEKYIVQPNEMLHFSLSLMDADPLQRAVLQDAATPRAVTMHAPGYVSIADSARREASLADTAYDRRDEVLTASWKNPPALDPMSAKPATIIQPSTGDAADSAWERRNAALERAYLGA